MRVRILLTVTIVMMAALVLAQQSTPPSTTPPSEQQPLGQPMSTPQSSTQQPMAMPTSSQEGMVKTAQDADLKTIPGLPDCVKGVVERGDPKTGPYVAYVKQAAGCTIPWHWHSANEQVMYASGSGQLQMKGQQAQTVDQGAYAYIPSKHQHQLTCPSGCTYHLSRDAAADVHYVDAAGNEITPETALAAVGEHPASAVAAKQ